MERSDSVGKATGNRQWALRLMTLSALLVLAVQAFARSATSSAPFDTPPHALKPGEFIWAPEAVPAGPLVMVISLDEQLAYVYRNGLRIGTSTVSTGKKGKETPTGVFTILQKHKEHKSTLYDDAPMPFMQRLTWDGIALHAGNLPGYPASHVCVRLPYEFARRLFDVTNFGMTVVIASQANQDAELAHPELFSPPAPDAAAAAAPGVPRLSWSQAFRWTPELSPSGPLTILVSASDRMVLVIRNGTEIGRARIIVDGDAPFGTQAYVMLAGTSGAPSTVLPDRPGFNWQAIPLPGYAVKPGTSLDPEAARRVVASPDFARLVYDQMVPGTTLVLTDAPALPRNTGEAMTVITADDQPEPAKPAVTEDPKR
jgi:hypothetical protein